MRGLRNVLNHFRYIKANNVLVIVFFAIGLFAFGALGLAQRDDAKAMVRDCDANAIMQCGAETAQEFKDKCNANAPGDLKAIYGHYWIPCDIQVVEGVSYKDNTVRVNGRIVADNAQSIGRQQKPGDHAISIAGRTYYEGPNSSTFASDALPTFVALDAQGNFKYAVIKGCGNPVYAHPVNPTPPPPPPAPEQPKYSCDSLTVQELSTTQKRFVVSASASGGAQIVGYTINFGDGSSQDITGTSIDHTFAKAGTFTVVATAKVSVNGKIVTASGAQCTKQFVIKSEAKPNCVAVNVISKGGTTYYFTLNKADNGATFKSATFDFGDGTNEQVNGISATHTYAKAGNYTITATLKYENEGQIMDVRCSGQVTTETCPNDATLPKDSPDCYCPYNASITKTNPACQAPAAPQQPQLPKTGPSDMILGGVGFGSMLISASLYLGSRRDLLASLIGE